MPIFLLTELDPILGKLYYAYYILYVYQKFFSNWLKTIIWI